MWTTSHLQLRVRPLTPTDPRLCLELSPDPTTNPGDRWRWILTPLHLLTPLGHHLPWQDPPGPLPTSWTLLSEDWLAWVRAILLRPTLESLTPLIANLVQTDEERDFVLPIRLDETYELLLALSQEYARLMTLYPQTHHLMGRLSPMQKAPSFDPSGDPLETPSHHHAYFEIFSPDTMWTLGAWLIQHTATESAIEMEDGNYWIPILDPIRQALFQFPTDTLTPLPDPLDAWVTSELIWPLNRASEDARLASHRDQA